MEITRQIRNQTFSIEKINKPKCRIGNWLHYEQKTRRTVADGKQDLIIITVPIVLLECSRFSRRGRFDQLVGLC